MPSLSGFINYAPAEQIRFDEMLRTIASSYATCGFTPLNLPAVERLETLTSKGNDGEIFTLGRINNEDFEVKMGLRFDLTVPFARYVADTQNDLTFPYRRYQIQPVWRGERSQRGRYREFYQADIDIVDRGTLSLEADADILATLDRTLQVLEIPGGYTIVLNNRKFLEGFLLAQKANSEEISPLMNIIDKVKKIGVALAEQEISTILQDRFVGENWKMFFASSDRDFDAQIQEFARIDEPLLTTGLSEIQSTKILFEKLGGNSVSLRWDPTIARGLAYYTGNVFETFLTADPSLGSIASGGRYENLTGLFSTRKFPGVGVSIGASRLFAYLSQQSSEVSQLPEKSVFIIRMDESSVDVARSLLQKFRAENYICEMCLDVNSKLSDQLKYASKKGYRAAIIIGSEEIKNATYIWKDLVTGVQEVRAM